MSGSKLIEKFTERAKKTIGIAAEEAKAMGSAYVDTEHLLIGILNDDGGIAYKILSSFKVDPVKVKEMILSSTDDFVGFSFEQRGFSDSAQEALANATLQAYLWKHPYVGTEHILCGLAKTSSGLACHILRSYGLDYKSILEKVSSMASYPESLVKGRKSVEPETPLLNKYSRDLTVLAREGNLDPVISRDLEINRCLQILARRTKNNPVLLGEAGVGKTAIVEGLAQRIASKEVPQKFHQVRLVSLDLNALVAGTRFRGDFEERLVGVLEEIRAAKNIVLFIDELHNLVGAGSAGGAMDAANVLKPALARGEIRCIGATTTEEYTHFIEEDSALERRFQPVVVEEPTEETTMRILEGLKARYESHHSLRIEKEALRMAVNLAKKYFVERRLPDSAIDLLDEASSKKAISAATLPPKLVELQVALEKVQLQKEEMVRKEFYEEAVKLRKQESQLQARINRLMSKEKLGKKPLLVTGKDIAELVSDIIKAPLEEVSQAEAIKLLNLEKEMKKKVIGQEEAIETVAKTVRRSRAGIADPNRPIGSFIFLGPTGVGKTLLAKILAETVFGNASSLIRLDMGEFSERHTVSRLLGAPPGYVGYEEGSELAEKLRYQPYSVVLLDEIEKAHPEVFNTLLQVLEEGRLVDGKGREINFKNTIIVMTSNVGVDLIKKGYNLGFGTKANDRQQVVKERLLEQLRKSFRPEFLNRIDNVVVFKMLEKEEVQKVAKLVVGELQGRLKKRDIFLKVSPEAWKFLEDNGFNEEYGARPMRRLVQELIEDPLSEMIIKGKLTNGSKVRVLVKHNKLIVS
jgi:ATP-dependent Clp protease ATP-binding subunit ClpC